MGSADKRKMLARVRAKERKRNAGKCAGKVAYVWGDAMIFASTYQQAPYHCPICKKWHLTSGGGGQRRRKNAAQR
jgi:hypothetical protein